MYLRQISWIASLKRISWALGCLLSFLQKRKSYSMEEWYFFFIMLIAMKWWMFWMRSLHESGKSANDFISCLELATFSKFIITSLSSISWSQFLMNFDMMSIISCKKSWIFYCYHCLVKIVMSLRAYYLDKSLKFGYISQILLRKSLRFASSNVSDVFLHILIIDFRANSWMWSAEYLLILVC